MGEAKKKAILVTFMSEGAYILLQSLISPDQIDRTTVTFNRCVEALRSHFHPPTCGFAERFKFYSARKAPTESMSDWAVRVRALAIICNFGVNLNEAIRDKFVFGLEKGRARDKNFLEPITSSFEHVLNIANNTEYIRQQYEGIEVIDEDLNFIRIANTIRYGEKIFSIRPLSHSFFVWRKKISSVSVR